VIILTKLSLKNSGLHFAETDLEVYMEGRAYKFLQMVMYIMREVLCSLAIKSMEAFIQFFNPYNVERDSIAILFEGLISNLKVTVQMCLINEFSQLFK
jgi:hypothetical protein